MRTNQTKQQPRVTDQLRQAIEAGPKRRSDISRDTQVDKGLLSRFVHGKAGLSGATIDKLCEYLGLELRPIGRPSEERAGR